MHNIDLILTLTGGLAAALILGFLTHRLGLSPIVGYLLAGVAVGPHTPGFIADAKLAEQMAEIGVILLMFGVGLHFQLPDLLAVRRVALPGAIGQSVVATILGAGIAVAFGWNWKAGIVFGIALSVASTVVLTRVLSDNRDLHTPTGHIAIGWLIMEDIFTVIVLVLLPSLFGPQQNEGVGALAWAISLALLKMVALGAFTFLVGGRVIPWVLDRVAATRSRELFTLTVLVVALGIAVGSTKLFGVSMALGAFLAGMVVGRSEFSLRAATEALPMRDAFAVLFFVSVGMLLDPKHILNATGFVAATLAVILLGKPLVALVIVIVLRYPLKTALGVAVALAQIGEFSFILAALGNQLKILPPGAMDTLVAAAIISITLNPILYRLVDPFDAWVSRRTAIGRRLAKRLQGSQHVTANVPEPTAHRAVVVGYGPVGRTVARLLKANEIEPSVIEMNLDTVRKLREQGIHAIYGDATQRDSLKEADVASAGHLILSSAGMKGSEETIRLAQDMNPEIRILARVAYVRDIAALRKAGVQSIFSGEGEVALAMTVALLRELGATPEQVDLERDRLRSELDIENAPDRVADPAKYSFVRPERGAGESA